MPLRRSPLIFKSNPDPLQGEIYEPTFIPAGPAHQGKHFALIDRRGQMQKRGGSVFLLEIFAKKEYPIVFKEGIILLQVLFYKLCFALVALLLLFSTFNPVMSLLRNINNSLLSNIKTKVSGKNGSRKILYLIGIIK